MRTLKKVLALSLVCAMAFTMMAGAAFNDQSKINADLANDIELMTALSVFKGDDKGNLNPEDLLTRAQAAKLIYVLKNNGNDDGAVAFTGVSTYADVPVGFWGEGYINFCTNSGYMGGWMQNGVRMFDPNGQVTGVEMAKMLLCLVGYKADLQGYAGANWMANVTSDALNANIFLDYGLGYNAPVSRQWAARLLTNAINANVVTYSKGELSVGDKTYAEKSLKLSSYVGKLTETKTVAVSKTDPAKGAVTNTSRSVVGNQEINYDAPANLLMQNVKVYYKAGTTATNATAEEKLAAATKIYSVMPSDSKVYNVKLDEIKVDGSKVSFPGYTKKDQYASTADEGANTSNQVRVINNFRENAALTAAIDATDSAKVLTTTLRFGKNDNRTVRIVTNAKGYIETVFYNTPVYAVVKTVDTAKNKLALTDGAISPKAITLYANGEIKNDASGMVFDTTDTGKTNFAKLNFVDTLAKGDVISIMPNYTTGKVMFDIKKLTPMSGKVTSFGVGETAFSSLTIDGTAYKPASVKLAGYTFGTGANADKISAKDATTFYSDGKYLVYATGEKTATALTKNIAYVIDAVKGDTAFGTARTAKVKLLFADNTIKTLNYTASDDQANTAIDLWKVEKGTEPSQYATQIVPELVYEYIMAEDGTVSLKPIATTLDKTTTGVATNVTTYVKADKEFTVNGVVAKADENSVVFSKYSDTKYAAVKASEINYNITNADGNNKNTGGKNFAYNTATGIPVLNYATVSYAGAIPSSLASGKYAVVTGSSSMGAAIDKNNSLVTLPVTIDGTASELKFKVANADVVKEMSNLNLYKNRLVQYSLKGEYVDRSKNAVEGDKFGVATIGTYATDKNWSKLAIEGSNANVIFGKDRVNATEYTGRYYNITADTKVIYVSLNADGKVTLLAEGEIAQSATLDKTGEAMKPNALVFGVNPTTGTTKNAKTIVVEVNGADISSLLTGVTEVE